MQPRGRARGLSRRPAAAALAARAAGEQTRCVLVGLDRIVVATPDRRATAQAWQALLGARPEREDRVGVLGATRTTLRLGTGAVELLEPDGTGPVARAVSQWGGQLFAAGAATPELASVLRRLGDRLGREPPVEGGQAWLDAADTGGHGLRLVVTEAPPSTAPAVGLAGELYEVTNLVHDVASAVSGYASLLGLEVAERQPIVSAQYGYEGTLLFLAEGRLDRLEVITPTDDQKTLGRFFRRRGESLYMAFMESDRLEEVLGRASERRVGATPVEGRGRLDTVFLHPDALGGVMLGLSRPGLAWAWSGHPERVA
jgi:catechol 2,3-dioxygenase-like lactoylglutathione lyase family enzyme